MRLASVFYANGTPNLFSWFIFNTIRLKQIKYQANTNPVHCKIYSNGNTHKVTPEIARSIKKN